MYIHTYVCMYVYVSLLKQTILAIVEEEGEENEINKAFIANEIKMKEKQQTSLQRIQNKKKS